MGERLPSVAAWTPVATRTGSDTTSQIEAAARTANNTPTTPTRLRLKRAEVIGERAQCTTGCAHLPVYAGTRCIVPRRVVLKVLKVPSVLKVLVQRCRRC